MARITKRMVKAQKERISKVYDKRRAAILLRLGPLCFIAEQEILDASDMAENIHLSEEAEDIMRVTVDILEKITHCTAKKGTEKTANLYNDIKTMSYKLVEEHLSNIRNVITDALKKNEEEYPEFKAQVYLVSVLLKLAMGRFDYARKTFTHEDGIDIIDIYFPFLNLHPIMDLWDAFQVYGSTLKTPLNFKDIPGAEEAFDELSKIMGSNDYVEEAIDMATVANKEYMPKLYKDRIIKNREHGTE